MLRDELRARGIDAWHHYEPYPKDATAIYPEICPENYLNAPRSIWWLLNKADFPGQEMWAWETGMGDHPLLTVDIIEPLWHERGLARSGVSYWIGKGALDGSILPEGATEIHRGNYPNRRELAEHVASLDYLISFDPFTALNIEAAISGTPVLIHAPRNQWSRDDFEAHAWVRHGIAWSREELEAARQDVHLAADDYDRKRRQFALRIDNFIQTVA